MKWAWIIFFLGAGAALGQAPRAAVEASKPKPAGSAAPPALAEPPRPIPLHRLKLPNGLRVILATDPQLPIWRGSVIAGAGDSADPADRKGLAELTAQVLMNTGTAKLTPAEAARILRRAGAQVTGASYSTRSLISFASPAATAIDVLAWLRESVQRPMFRRAALEGVDRMMANSARPRPGDLRAVADREFFLAIRGRPNSGTPSAEGDSLPIHTEHLAEFHRTWWDPSNVVLVLTGDFELEAMAKKISAEWGEWQSRGQPRHETPPGAGPAGPQLLLYSPENTQVSSIAMGQWLANLTISEEAALQVFARLFHQRLETVKNKGQYTLLGVSAGTVGEPSRPFRIFANVAVRETVDAVKSLSRMMEELRNEPAPAADLAEAKRQVLDEFAGRFDRPWKAAEFAGESLICGRPEDFPQKFHDAVASLTAADLNKLIRARLAPEKNVLAIAGDERDFRDPAATLGIPVRKITLSAASASASRSARPPAGTAAASLDPAKGAALLERMRTAMGGLARLQTIKDGDWRYQATVFTAASSHAIEQRIRWLASGAIRQEEKTPAGEGIIYYDGKIGWNWQRQQKMPLQPTAVRQFSAELFRTPYTLALSDRVPGRSIDYLGSSIFRVSDGNGNSVDVALDETTHLPDFYRYVTYDQNGNPLTLEERFTDYRPVDGVQVAHQIEIFQSGRLIAEFRLNEIKFNTGIAAAVLDSVP